MKKIFVIGAGIGGLTVAAALSKKGMDVTVLEAQTYPGGCAGTFISHGYRFDAGATLAGGFYPGGPMDFVGQACGIATWPTKPADVAMAVHLPDGTVFERSTLSTDFSKIQTFFGQPGVEFFTWQQKTADAMWDLALKLPSWPPTSITDMIDLGKNGIPWALRRNIIGILRDSFGHVADHLEQSNEMLRLMIDGQLLISAQTTSDFANATYGAAALDLPRRGVVHVEGGMGAISQTLVTAIIANGGKVIYKQKVTKIRFEKSDRMVIETKSGQKYEASRIISNLLPWNLAELLDENTPKHLRKITNKNIEGWSAFVVYVGLDGSGLSADHPLHHQILLKRPLGEGNSVFASLSPDWDRSRAPLGHRALTLSTHTNLRYWWDLFENDFEDYTQQKNILATSIIDTASRAIPGLSASAKIVLPGTPITYQQFIGRKLGWVGGFPQTNLFQQVSPRISHVLWQVGDSIFPGQSTAAVALGGLRVANMILNEPLP